MKESLINTIQGAVEDLGFTLVQMVNNPKAKILQIIIDKPGSEKVTIGDCSRVNRHLSILFEVEGGLPQGCGLEVASCGIEKPLVDIVDYQNNIDQVIKVKLIKVGVGEDANFNCLIKRVDNEDIYVTKYRPKLNKGRANKQATEEELKLNIANILSARLVLTDDFFKKLLKKEV